MANTTTIKEKPKSNFKLQKLFLKFAGISFTGNESIFYKLYSLLLLFTPVYVYAVLDGYELFKHDFDTASGIMTHESMIIVTMIKTGIVLKNRITVGKLLDKLDQEPFLPNPNRGGAEEERLIRECKWIINAQILVYWVSAVICISFSNFYALSTRLRSSDYHNWELGFGPFTVLNNTHSPNYEISWLYQTYSIWIIGVYLITIDLTIIGALAHISYQFKILQNSLRVIVTRSYEEMLKDQTNSGVAITRFEHDIAASEIPWKYLEKSVKQAARYHQAIIDIAKEMEDVFRYLFMLTFLISLLCLCFELYLASYFLLEFSICVFQVATICYWGEQVMFESQEVGKAAMESNFIGSDVRFQKALVLIVRRSQTSTKLTAGKFADLCLTTFTWIMRASYSVFMVIRNTNRQNI